MPRARGPHLIIRPISAETKSTGKAIILPKGARREVREQYRGVEGYIESVGPALIVADYETRKALDSYVGGEDYNAQSFVEFPIGAHIAYNPILSGTFQTVRDGEVVHLEVIHARDVLAIFTAEDVKLAEEAKAMAAQEAMDLAVTGEESASGRHDLRALGQAPGGVIVGVDD